MNRTEENLKRIRAFSRDNEGVIAFAVRDTKGYADDKDPSHWRRINGAPVHIDNEGNIDGGAGGKFAGKKWSSTKHPHKPKATVTSKSKAETQKKATSKASKAGETLTGYKGLKYNQAATGANANTIEGTVHNLIVSYLGKANPTRKNIAAAAACIADEELNFSYMEAYRNYKNAKSKGNEAAIKGAQKDLQDATKAINLARSIMSKMSAPQTTTSPNATPKTAAQKKQQ